MLAVLDVFVCIFQDTDTQEYNIIKYLHILSCFSECEGLVKLCELWLSVQTFLSFFTASLSVSKTSISPSKLKHKTRIIFYSPHNTLGLLLHLSHREELGHQCFDCVWSCVVGRGVVGKIVLAWGAEQGVVRGEDCEKTCVREMKKTEVGEAEDRDLPKPSRPG